jgi:acetoin utilization deacetylase AcuC-like enzyme
MSQRANNSSPIATIPIFFSQQMQAKVESLSPSAHKPWEAVQSWIALEVPLTILHPRPVTREELARAHDRAFVDAILECRAMNGFYTKAPDVAASLPHTSGAMLGAAREAIHNGQVAVAPTCGFHHACHAVADKFCTFNGLMVSALAVKAEGLADRVGILDFDQHYGDGTEEIIQALRTDFVKHYTAAEFYHQESQADEFLSRVPELVAAMKDCDVLLYQAGADPHVDDPLGGWLTNEQLAERDRLVFETARELKIPVAWNLAGGYQTPLRKVLDIHDNTMRACAATYLGTRDIWRSADSQQSPLASQDAVDLIGSRTESVFPWLNVQVPPDNIQRGLAAPAERKKGPMPETPPLTRAGRRAADAKLAAAKFKPTSDGKRVMRQFEVHGIAITECVNAEQIPDADKTIK